MPPFKVQIADATHDLRALLALVAHRLATRRTGRRRVRLLGILIAKRHLRHALPHAFSQPQHNLLNLRQVGLSRSLFPVQKFLNHRLRFR